VKTYLLAIVSTIFLIGAAQAGDVSKPYSKTPVLDPSWAGFYAGIQGGVVRHEASFNDLGNLFGMSTYNTSKTGALVGGYAGYNWQDRSFVYGVESDINWVGAKATALWGAAATAQQSQDISWLATFRARAGLDIDSTLLFVTGGVAIAGANQSFNTFCAVQFNGCFNVAPGAFYDGFSRSQTQVGWTAGVGFEHMLDRHWTIRAEARYVDLGRSDSGSCIGAGCANLGPNLPYRGEFSNTLVTGMAGVGYKF
jgi:outer membrane immunogenic protein